MKNAAAVLALVLALSAQAMAQGKGGGGLKGGGKGGGFGGDFGERGARVHWFTSLESVFGGEAAEKKYLLVYVRPLAEAGDPSEFNNEDVVRASHREWAFVRVDPDKDNPAQRSWGVKTAGVLVGCDLYGNSFMGPVVSSTDQLRRILGALPGAVGAYEQKIKSDYGKAVDALKTDESKGTRLLIDLAAAGKPGYKETTQAQAKVAEQAEVAFKRGELAESVSAEVGIEYYEELAKTYRGTAPSARADLRIARLESGRGNAKGAQAKLQPLLKLDPRVFRKEIDEAQRLLEEVSRAR